MFKAGKFFSVQANTVDDEIVYVEALTSDFEISRAKLRALALRSAALNKYRDDDPAESNVKIANSPFDVKLWAINTPIKTLTDQMRSIRLYSQQCKLNPNSIKLVVVESSVETFVPETPSDEETELRRFVLEKLTDEEKKLLKVEHWEVYGKLADNSMFDKDPG